MFTTSQDVTSFRVATDQVTDQLRLSGYQVEQTRLAPQFARRHVATETGCSWRTSRPECAEGASTL